MIDADALRLRIQRLGPWYHNIDLGAGVGTNPTRADYPRNRWETIEPFIPVNLHGKRVLDIGCNGGYFSIEMKRRGADSVIGIDTSAAALAQARFAAAHLGVDVDFRKLSVYEIGSLGGSFDVVLFMGVLYHLRHPLLALDHISSVCTGVAFVQSIIRGPAEPVEVLEDYPENEWRHLEQPAYPKLYFVEQQYAGDPTNWWIPNREGLLAMIRSAGFASIWPTRDDELFVCYRQETCPPPRPRSGAVA